MCKENFTANKALLEEYKDLAEKAMKTPADTEELIELTEYITKQREVGVKELETRLEDSVKRVKFLVSHSTVPDAKVCLYFLVEIHPEKNGNFCSV